MAKQIVISYEGKDYTLEFNRKVVKQMEEGGFTIDTARPATMITELFKGAFRMHHRKIDPALVEEIWDAQRKKDTLLSTLVQMYTEPIASLMDEDEQAEDENPTWKVL